MLYAGQSPTGPKRDKTRHSKCDFASLLNRHFSRTALHRAQCVTLFRLLLQHTFTGNPNISPLSVAIICSRRLSNWLTQQARGGHSSTHIAAIACTHAVHPFVCTGLHSLRCHRLHRFSCTSHTYTRYVPIPNCRVKSPVFANLTWFFIRKRAHAGGLGLDAFRPERTTTIFLIF